MTLFFGGRRDTIRNISTILWLKYFQRPKTECFMKERFSFIFLYGECFNMLICTLFDLDFFSPSKSCFASDFLYEITFLCCNVWEPCKPMGRDFLDCFGTYVKVHIYKCAKFGTMWLWSHTISNIFIYSSAGCSCSHQLGTVDLRHGEVSRFNQDLQEMNLSSS